MYLPLILRNFLSCLLKENNTLIHLFSLSGHFSAFMQYYGSKIIGSRNLTDSSMLQHKAVAPYTALFKFCMFFIH